MKAWLITWEWSGDAAAVADRVVAILNPRWSVDRVIEIVEFLYAECNYNLNEQVAFARKPKNNPYRAIENFGLITCGHNPWLEARKVDKFEIFVDPKTKLETITWLDFTAYRIVKSRPEAVGKPKVEKFARRITGPVSHELIWDRKHSRFKKGWCSTRERRKK